MTPDLGRRTEASRKPGGNATVGELYAALAAGALPGRLPARRKRRAALFSDRPAGFKAITDGLGRRRYRKRMRVNGRKVSVVVRCAP